MSSPVNNGKAWTAADEKQLRQLAAGNTPTRLIGLKMGRTPASIQSYASKIGLSLKPANQSPYGPRKGR